MRVSHERAVGKCWINKEQMFDWGEFNGLTQKDAELYYMRLQTALKAYREIELERDRVIEQLNQLAMSVMARTHELQDKTVRVMEKAAGEDQNNESSL